MNVNFTGKRILVTGSTSGIGFAAAQGFVAAGGRVVINGRSDKSVSRALVRLKGAEGFAGDLSRQEDCERLVSTFPAFDIVVNNIGIFGPQDFFAIPDAEWSRFFDTNVMSGVRVSRAYAPGMAERGWGRIIFIASESALNIPSDMIHYGMTKTAQLAVSRGLAKRLAGTGVTVNAILPGPTLSEGVAGMIAPDGGNLEEIATDFVMTHRRSSIIRRAARVEEVANMILYIASEQASATAGASLRVDGGVVDII